MAPSQTLGNTGFFAPKIRPPSFRLSRTDLGRLGRIWPNNDEIALIWLIWLGGVRVGGVSQCPLTVVSLLVTASGYCTSVVTSSFKLTHSVVAASRLRLRSYPSGSSAIQHTTTHAAPHTQTPHTHAVYRHKQQRPAHRRHDKAHSLTVKAGFMIANCWDVDGTGVKKRQK